MTVTSISGTVVNNFNGLSPVSGSGSVNVAINYNASTGQLTISNTSLRVEPSAAAGYLYSNTSLGIKVYLIK